jgi:hypothetical protein
MNIASILKALKLVLFKESNEHYTPYTQKNSRRYNCKIARCSNKAYAKKLCNAHYIRARAGIDLSLPLRCVQKGPYLCSCGKPRGTTGGWFLCATCYGIRRRLVLKQELVRLLGDKCSNCRHSFPHYVYDFHHTNNKTAGIGELLENASLKRLAQEASKCVLLCANCHRKETHGKV